MLGRHDTREQAARTYDVHNRFESVILLIDAEQPLQQRCDVHRRVHVRRHPLTPEGLCHLANAPLKGEGGERSDSRDPA